MCCRDVDTDLDARRFVLGQNVAQHIAQATEHGQHALAALAALGVRAEQQPNASGIVVQRIAALHILGQDAARERERESRKLESQWGDSSEVFAYLSVRTTFACTSSSPMETSAARMRCGQASCSCSCRRCCCWATSASARIAADSW